MADQSLHSPIKPHFFKPLLPGFRTHLNIPIAFYTKHVEGKNDQNKTAKLRSDASDITWLVKMDGSEFTNGWEDFALAHDFRIGDILVFRHEGEMLFHVTALGPSCCEIQYTSSLSHNINEDEINIAPGNSSRVKKNPKKKVESGHSHFVAKVSAWSISNDRLYIPLSFARLNGLNKMRGKKIYLHNEEGRSWKLALKHDKTGMQTIATTGWTRFCAANRIGQGYYIFKLVRKSEPPVIRLCRTERRPKQRSESESSSQYHSYFEGSVTASSLNKDRLVNTNFGLFNYNSHNPCLYNDHWNYLPRSFVSSNGLDKGCREIILKNEKGGKWTLALKQYLKPISLTYLRKGWTGFCQANGIKAGDSFKFKMVEAGKKHVLSLCPVESNRGKTPLECSEDNDDVKSKESEEESMEDKNTAQECFEFKKRKYCSRCRGSVESMDGDQTNIVTTGNSSREKRVKTNPEKKVEPSSDHSSFVANVSASSLSHDRLYLPLDFARSNGLDKMTGEKIILLNEEGRSWKLNLKHNKAGKHTLVRPGWTRFCSENGMSQGQQYLFKLVQKSGPPVIRLHLAQRRPTSEPQSSSDHSCFEGSVTASSLINNRLYLPRSFVIPNGLDVKRCSEIVLKNAWGKEWTLLLKHFKSHKLTFLKQGWTSFCQVNGLKAGDSFKFKLVGTGEKPVLSLCPADSNHEKTPLECPEGSDDVQSLSSNHSSRDDSIKSEESDEESIRDMNISRECLEIKRRKYRSSCRASSSYSQNRFLTLTLTQSAFRSYKLFLPRGFTKVNGINKPGKITLLGQDGVKRVVDLFQDKRSKIMRFGKGWREFCEAQGVKIDDSFVLELIWEEEASPVLKFCTKLNSA